jgi:hypothetical protein
MHGHIKLKYESSVCSNGIEDKRGMRSEYRILIKKPYGNIGVEKLERTII